MARLGILTTTDRLQSKLRATLGLQTTVGLVMVLIAAVLALYLRSEASNLALIWVFGLAFGFILQRGRFCFASAFRDLFLFGDGRVMKGILAGLAIATVGFALVMYTYSPTIGAARFPLSAHVFPLGVHTLVAGVIFGVGMVVAGGCISGNLYRMGEGYVTSWVAILGAAIGLVLLSHTWNWWWRTSISSSPTVWLGNSLGWTWAVVLTLGLLFAVYLLVAWRESHSGVVGVSHAPVQATGSGLGERLRGIATSVFRRPWPVITAGVSLGLLNVFVYLYSHPLGVTGEIWRWAGTVTEKLGIGYGELLGMSGLGGCTAGEETPGLLTWGLLIDGGLVLGALAAGLLAAEFKLRFPRQGRRYLQSLGGGILLGYGAGLGLGCTIGAFFSAIPSLAINGWVFGAGLALGAMAGVQIIKKL